MAEQPFTLAGYSFDRKLNAALTPSEAMPPKHNYPGSPANYWLLDEQIVSNMQPTITPLDGSVPVFKSPHAVIEGTVQEIINEQDGDTHVWVVYDGGSKGRLACEWTPQTNVPPPPAVGTHIRVYGLIRYDLQHGWWELHPVDFWEEIK